MCSLGSNLFCENINASDWFKLSIRLTIYSHASKL